MENITADDRTAEAGSNEEREAEPSFRDTFRLTLVIGGLMLAMWLTMLIVFLIRL
ncbi:MAG: hypothetical protein IMW86_02155 [Hydrogenibacillus sp.]|nr:hypothetical protein [Hydrogenibacillus sp.]